MTTPIVQTKNLSKIYQSGEVPMHALDNINFAVQPGSFTAIIGKSGCGKSTLLHMMGSPAICSQKVLLRTELVIRGSCAAPRPE